MKNVELSKHDLTCAEGRANFIEDTPSGIYEGVNIDGDSVYVFVDRGKGMTIKTCHACKPNWLECIDYDQYGWQESVSYEPAKN